MAGDESEVENLKLKVKDLETELSNTKEELKASREELEKKVKDINKTQRKLEKSNLYNDDLRKQIKTLSQEIQVFRDRRRDVKHVGLQAVAEEILTALGEKPLPQWDNETTTTAQEPEDKSTSIAESLKQTAEAALAQTGFVYDEKTGLYYDYNSGYYYNCEHGLYYDPSSGTYFYYDETSGEYTFHSQVEPQYTCPVTQASTKGENSDRRRKRAKDRKEKESVGKEKGKKRKKEKDDKENSKSRKHKSRKNTHKSNKKRDHSESKNDDQFSGDVQSHHHKRSKKKLKSHSKDERSDSSADKKRSKSKENRNSKQSKSQAIVEVIEIWDSSEDNQGTEHPPPNQPDLIVLSEGEISSDSLATGESELESGELTSDSEPDSSTSEEEEEEEDKGEREEEMAVDDFTLMGTEQDDVSESWPPCIRVMVKESDCLEEGTLFIVTCGGATIGREKDMNHLIRIPDINVSKHHADIQFDYEAGSYVVVDCGSQNGTFLNSKCISQGKNERSVRALGHDDTLQMGNTTLLLHIHPGTDTCDDCEPGQVLSRIREMQRKEVVIQSKEDRQREQRKQLKQIKKKYGLENAAYIDNTAAINNPAYQDKAATRRREVGSDNPHVVDEAPASVMRPISTENKGHRLLAKMGWKEGQGLGKDNAGISEPINVMLRTNQSAGLGSSSAVEKTLDDVQSVKKSQRWLQAQQRYNKIGQSRIDTSQPTNVSFSFKKGPNVNLKPKVDLGTVESDSEEEEKS